MQLETTAAQFTAVRSRASFVLFWWLFAGALTIHFAYIEVVNDHFDRISRGHQILAFGAVPFRDFFDPGWLLTIYSSAAAQSVFGHRLLGEVVLTGVFTAAGIALAGVLVRAACNSRRAGLATAFVLLLAQPRAYDYDKVFFYAFGLFMCWSYAESPDRRRAITLAITAVVASLYRYDNGLYLTAAALITIAAVHRNDSRVLGRRLGVFAAAALMACAPVALFVATHGGIPNAVRQVVAYAGLERERTALDEWPRLSVDWRAPLVRIDPPTELDSQRMRVSWAAVARSTQVLPGWLTRNNAETLLFYLLTCLPVVAALRVSWEAVRRTSAGGVVMARGLAAASMCGLANAFVLRDPLRARYAAVAVPAAVLAGWLLRDAFFSSSGVRRSLRAAAVMASVAVTALAMAMLSLWVERLEPFVTFDEEKSAFERLLHERKERWSWVMSTTPDDHWIYGYLGRCTGPNDRVMVVDFQPQVPMYTRRGFAGGMLVFLGEHWSSAADQERIVQRLRRESVPIVISRIPDPLVRWPAVLDYVQHEYVLAGESAFGRNSDQPFSVRVKRGNGRRVSRDVEWGLPCFAP